MNKFLLFGLVLVLSAGLVSAVDVAYVLKDTSQVNARVASVLDDLGLSYDEIRNSELTQTSDFSGYKLILVADDVSREQFLPFEEKNSVFFHGGIANEAWNLISAGKTTKSFMKSTDLTSFVYEGVSINPSNNEIGVYSSASEMHYLSLSFQSGVTSVGLSTGSNSRPAIAFSTRENGEEKIKNFFFGAPVFDEWTFESEKIFKNAVNWALSDVDEDGDGFPSGEDCDDDDNTVFPGAEEAAYDGIDQDCDGFDLRDVDEDGFDSAEVGGFDCDDEDADVYPGNPDKALDCVNDAPEIISYTPSASTVKFVENSEGKFMIVVEDVDSEPDILWFLNGVEQSEKSGEFSLARPEGVYSLEVLVSDEEQSVNRFWNVIFGSASEFTCSEIGGKVCSEQSTCGGDLVGVGDTNACCVSTCIPNFDDVNSCEVIEEGIVIDVKKVETPELGESFEVELDVINNLDERQDVEVEIYLYDLDEDESIVDENMVSSVDDGRERSFKLSLDVPKDLDLDNEYAIFVKVDGDDGCNQFFENVEVGRPDDLAVISEFELPSELSCGSSARGRIEVQNLGKQDRDVELEIRGREIDFAFSEDFELEKFDEDDSFSESFDVEIPAEIEPGVYDVSARIVYGSESESLTKSIRVSCGLEEVEIAQTLPSVGRIMLDDEGQVVREFIDEVVSPNYELIAWILMLNFMLLAAVGILYLSWVRKKSKSRRK